MLIGRAGASAVTSEFKHPPQSKNGIIDLSNNSFREEIKLDGQGKFYRQKLVVPGDELPAENILVNFPFRWDGFILNGEKLAAFGYASYSVRVLLPEKPQEIKGRDASVYTAYRLFFNGKKVAEKKIDPSIHHLLLIDLHMPVMDGYEAASKMRAKGIKLPIIALTANLAKQVEAG